MAHELPYIAAIVEAIQLEMERDESVLYFGQNMATTENEPFVDAFGKNRVRVTPISETAEIGIAVGAALAGFRPVVELYMAEFMLVAMDQVLNEAPRFRGMSGGQVTVPIVLKAGYGFTAGWAGQHTGTIGAMFMQFHYAPSMFYDEGLTAPHDHGYCFGPVVIKPTSRGRVLLRAPLADSKPRVLCNFLTTEEDRRCMQLHATGRLVLKTETHELESVNDVLAKLGDGEVTGRAVLVP